MEDDPHIQFLRQKLRHNPYDSTLRLQLATALFERNRFADALAEAQRARQSPSSRTQAMHLQKQILTRL